MYQLWIVYTLALPCFWKFHISWTHTSRPQQRTTLGKLHCACNLHLPPETNQERIWQFVVETMTLLLLLLIREGKILRLLDLFVEEGDVAFSFFPLSLALPPFVPYQPQSSAWPDGVELDLRLENPSGKKDVHHQMSLAASLLHRRPSCHLCQLEMVVHEIWEVGVFSQEEVPLLAFPQLSGLDVVCPRPLVEEEEEDLQLVWGALPWAFQAGMAWVGSHHVPKQPQK